MAKNNNDVPTKHIRVETKTIVISQDNIDSAIVSFLYALGAIPHSWDVLAVDLPLPLNDDGYVEFDIEIAKPVRPKLQLVDANFKGSSQPQQMELPLEHFERIVVETEDRD